MMNIYMAVTTDQYQLPYAVATTAKELAEMCSAKMQADTPQTDVYDYKGHGKWERSE